MYALYLRHRGYEVVEAEDGVAAEQVATGSVPPDVVVLDMSLPGLDGWEVTRRLKQVPLARNIPVVALTGHGLPEHESRAREAGCAAFLVKPCLPDTLVAEIARLLRAEAPRTP